MIISAFIVFIIYINDNFRFNLELAFVVAHYEQEKNKTNSRKDIFMFNASELFFVMNEVLMGRPCQGLGIWQELPFNLRLNLMRKALCNWSLDVWSSYSLRPYERWRIRTWNTFRSFSRINNDLNYHNSNIPDSAPKRLNNTPFLKNTYYFTERHCFNSNRQIWGNNNYIRRYGFWTVDKVYRDPVMRNTNGFLQHTKHMCHSYSRHNRIENDFARNEIALTVIKSIQTKRLSLFESLSIQEINDIVINYEKQKSLNYTNRPFSYWQDYIFNSYTENFYRIEREHASLLVDRIDIHFDLNTSGSYVNHLIVNDIRDAELNLVKELLRKPLFP